jgi:hypothetical protein
VRGHNEWHYRDWRFDWREEPKVISSYSIALLVIFLGCFAFLGYMFVERPWGDDTAGPPLDARTFADRGLDPQPVVAPEAVSAE